MERKYESKLDLINTEIAIKKLKDYFEKRLASALDLLRVSAPLFVAPETGLNDNLNEIERPVSFDTIDRQQLQIVQSLAKWKRMALYRYGIKGLYTDMNAIRRDEIVDSIHSYYVDQWDWEKVITKGERTIDTLKEVVSTIYEVLKKTDSYIVKEYPMLKKKLPDEIVFITSQQLEDQYPDMEPKEREYMVCKKYRAVCLTQIGKTLKSGKKHDGRAADYDDWELNCDILVYNEVLDIAFELSSMGIRVDAKTLVTQLKEVKQEYKLELEFHKAIIDGKLPYTIGGGIGQSRLCMFLLEKIHIGEVQQSVWPEKMISECKEKGINLL